MMHLPRAWGRGAWARFNPSVAEVSFKLSLKTLAATLLGCQRNATIDLVLRNDHGKQAVRVQGAMHEAVQAGS